MRTALLCAMLLTGCAWTYPPGSPAFTPEAPAPSAARLADLLALPLPALTAQAHLGFTLTVYPPVVRLGHAIRITCWVPRDHPAAWIRYGLSDHASRGWMKVEHIENRFLIERVGCGQHVAFCHLSTGELRTQAIEVEC